MGNKINAAGIVEGAAGGIIGTGMGLLLENHNDRRQLEQQRKLGEQEMGMNKEMAEFNRLQQMKLWEDTNYKAQMAQLKKAGLNPALIYGMSGGGGATTAAAEAQGVSGGNAPMGGGEAMGMGMGVMGTAVQTALVQAQKDLIEAQAKTEGEKPANIAAGTANTKADTLLKGIEARIKEVEAEIVGRTKEDAIDIITSEASSAITDAKRVQRQNQIEQATMQITLDRIKAEYIGVLLSNANTAQDTKLKGAQTATEGERPYMVREEARAIGRKLLQEDDKIVNEGRRITNEQIRGIMGDKGDIGEDIINAIQSILLMRAATTPAKPGAVQGFKTGGR